MTCTCRVTYSCLSKWIHGKTMLSLQTSSICMICNAFITSSSRSSRMLLLIIIIIIYQYYAWMGQYLSVHENMHHYYHEYHHEKMNLLCNLEETSSATSMVDSHENPFNKSSSDVCFLFLNYEIMRCLIEQYPSMVQWQQHHPYQHLQIVQPCYFLSSICCCFCIE